MEIEFDPLKSLATLEERGLDMADAWRVFAASHVTAEDTRFGYPEVRHITVGYLDNRMVVVVWTKRGHRIRIISFRKANEREQEKFKARLAGP